MVFLPGSGPALSARGLRGLAALVVCICVFAGGCGGSERALPRNPGRLRYDLVEAVLAATYAGSFVVADLDGDGIDESVKYDAAFGGSSFLAAARVRGNQFYALHTKHLLSKGGVCGFAEITGDGAPELIWWWHSSRETAQVFASRIDVAEATATLTTEVSLKFDTENALLPDGQWAASAVMLGPLDLDDNGVADALAMHLNAGITGYPREVFLWDMKSGEIRWRLPTGATPTGGSALVDINGDGREDIVLGLESPGNGFEAGRWDDGHSYVIAVDAEGDVLWSQELGGYSTHVRLAAADLDRDGSVEVVTALSYHSELNTTCPEISVWNGADGAPLDSLRIGCPANTVLAERCEEGERIFVGSADGALRRIRWENGSLEVESRLDCRDAVESIAAIEFPPDLDSRVLVVGTGRGAVAVIDRDLRPVAIAQLGETIDGARRVMPTTLDVSGEPVGGVIVRTAQSTHRLRLTKRPVPLWLRVAVPALVALIIAALIPTSRRFALAALRRWLLPRDSRDELLEQLLTTLTTAGHGRLSATSTFRRLRKQADMICASEGDVPAAFEERFRDALGNARDVGIPGVADIARLSDRVGVAPAHSRRLTSELAELGALLTSLPDSLPDAPRAGELRARLDDVLPSVDDALAGIKVSAESERASSLGVELGRALRARSAEITERGVEVERPDPGALRSARVLGTPRELAFVLDNLLGNALAAMADSPVRHVAISVEMGPKWVVVRVEDSGKGIPEAAHEQVFTRGVSDREGGGQGLPLSREILGRRGGTIELIRSAPGEGSLFELKLVLVRSA